MKSGLRQRKKEQTRLAISQVATRLFIRRGFDRVTIAEVADAADVSVNTIFNYFRTKEELFFDREQQVVSALAAVIRGRPRGQSVLDALGDSFRRTLDAKRGPLAGRNLRPFVKTIEKSPDLQARTRFMFEQAEAELTGALLDEARDEAAARMVAGLLMGHVRVLAAELRTRILRGEPGSMHLPAARRLAESGFRLLRRGVADFGRR